ncbi:hypothetical protein FK85_15815 [Halorubrum saccharovorum]|uniref:DUF7344 domain-containing protein n=1 Tax=Halorubrum saccharovorum TaxID=2248 RepID=A0A081ESG2_9EURY|nr:hypothetical protein FK85_15815 [Halorubrum saccharovorum]
MLRIAANPARRAILRHLIATDSRRVDVDDLATTIDSPEGPIDSETPQIAIELRHTHLPMLADADAITYDRGSEVVAYRGDDEIEALLEFVADRLE